MGLRAVLSLNERQMIRSFLTVSNGLLLTITDRTEIYQVHPKPRPSKAGAEDVEGTASASASAKECRHGQHHPGK